MNPLMINPPNPLTSPSAGAGGMGGRGMSDILPTDPSGGADGKSGGARMVFRVVQSLKALASAYPDVSQEVDSIISEVEGVGVQIMSGSQGEPSSSSPPSMGEMGMGGPF